MSHPYPPPPPYPGPPPVAPKKKRWPYVVGAVVLLFVVAGILGNGKGSGGGGDTPAAATGVSAGNEVSPTMVEQISTIAIPNAKPLPKNVVIYKVTGTGGAKASSINYTTDGMTSGNAESDVILPWEKKIELPAGEAIQMVSILAQGSGKGEITVTITVNGALFKQASAQKYGIAHANGNIGSMG